MRVALGAGEPASRGCANGCGVAVTAAGEGARTDLGKVAVGLIRPWACLTDDEPAGGLPGAGEVLSHWLGRNGGLPAVLQVGVVGRWGGLG